MSSTTTMLAQEVLDVCNKYLVEREEWLYIEGEKIIAQYVGKRIWWKPWKRFTREDAIDYLTSDVFSHYCLLGLRGGFEVDIIKSLKALAEQSVNGYVQVDAESAIVLQRVTKRWK